MAKAPAHQRHQVAGLQAGAVLPVFMRAVPSRPPAACTCLQPGHHLLLCSDPDAPVQVLNRACADTCTCQDAGCCIICASVLLGSRAVTMCWACCT